MWVVRQESGAKDAWTVSTAKALKMLFRFGSLFALGAADLGRRSLLALDDVLTRGSIATGDVQALAAEAQSLEAHAPDGPSKASAGLVRARLDDLAATFEADRSLRLNSPP